MKAILSLAFAAGLLFAGSAATAAVMAPPAPHSSAGLIQVRDGCGRGNHENRWGRCVSNDREWHDYRGDGCDRWHHRNRWGRCVRNW
jgi:hypothetical protein